MLSAALQRRFDALPCMLSLAPSPLPQKSKLLRSRGCGGGGETSFTDSSETREGLFRRGDAQQRAAYLHRKELLSSVRCQRHAQRRRKPYQQQLSRRHHTIVPPMNVIFDVYMILGINYM